MFRRARVRLTALYIALFALVLGTFSIVFYVGLATVLAPTFEFGPELSSEQVAEAAYEATINRVGLVLLVANVLVVVLVGLAAWVLAARTLRPIRDAHLQQRRFVADASHEMRTPLAAIRASAEGALAVPGEPDDLRGALAAVAASAERLTGITNDLLLLARSEEVPPNPPSPIDLSIVVAETVEAFEAAHPGLPRPRLSLAEDLRVSANPDEIGRIVVNLVDNAIRYAGPDAAPPRVATRAVDRDAVLEVRDDGPGIAPDDLERIFEPFHRVNPAAGAPAGTGLGLAIARSLARRNGAHLTVVSRRGRGSTFRLTLPRHR
jgi:signal transduction histidine kinase